MTRCPPWVKCRGVIPAVSHVMLQSDTLATEFNEILNLVEIFAPFQPLDPAVVFYAPLRNNTRDLRLNPDTFERNSEAWYLDGSGIYRRSLQNQARFENSRLLMEPAQTNKCVSYNANPDHALTGIGGSGGVVSVVNRESLIASAGLQDICTDGNVIELDNSAGGANANIVFNGVTGNTNHHVFSIWARRTLQAGTSNEVRINFTGGIAGNLAIGTEWKRYILATADNEPPTSTSEGRIIVEPGFGVECILQQWEESSVASSPIVTEGTAGQRARDSLFWSNVANIINQAQGSIIFEYFPRFVYSDVANNTRYDLTGIPTRMVYYERSSGAVASFRITDAAPDFPNVLLEGGVGPTSPDKRFVVGARWNQSIPDFQIGYSEGSGWTWGSTRAFTAFNLGDVFNLSPSSNLPSTFRNLEVYNVDLGTSGIEERYP